MTKDRTLAQRQAASRKRLTEEGGRQLGLAIPPDINARLNAEIDRTGDSARSIILRLLDQGLPLEKNS